MNYLLIRTYIKRTIKFYIGLKDALRRRKEKKLHIYIPTAHSVVVGAIKRHISADHIIGFQRSYRAYCCRAFSVDAPRIQNYIINIAKRIIYYETPSAL